MCGIDLRAIDAAEFSAIEAAWDEYAVLVFVDQQLNGDSPDNEWAEDIGQAENSKQAENSRHA